MIIGKRKLCYTDAADFTEIQGVGNDPIYKRYDSVYAVIKQCIDERFRSFLAEPEYSVDDDQVYWYVDEWGKDTSPIKYLDTTGAERGLCDQLLNETISHYESAIQKSKGENQKILRSALRFINKEFVYLINDHIVLAVWGMTPDTFQHEESGMVIHEISFSKTHRLSFDPSEFGKLENPLDGNVRRNDGTIISSRDLPNIIANEGYEFIAWVPDPLGVEVNSDLTFKATYKKVEKDEPIIKHHVIFIGSDGCSIVGNTELDVEDGHVLHDDEIPTVEVLDNYKFDGWNPDINAPIKGNTIFTTKCFSIHENDCCHVIFVGNVEDCELIGETEYDVFKGTKLSDAQIPQVKPNNGKKFIKWSKDLHVEIEDDTTFVAEFEDDAKYVTVNFNAGDGGRVSGKSSFVLPMGASLPNNEIPTIKEKNGYHFKGWDINPIGMAFSNDITINAIYETSDSWLHRFWIWLWGGGCLKRLLLFLLLLILLLLLLAGLHQCNGCSYNHVLAPNDTLNGPAVIDTLDNRFHDNPGNAIGGRIGDIPSTPIDQPDLGVGVDPGRGDGDYHSGVFPQDPSVPPIDNPDDPNGPQIVPNVLNVFFTKDNANLNAFAKDFRDLYPDTQKYLLDYDDYVKRVSIVMPVEERVPMKENLERNLGQKYDFIIVDEFAIQQSVSTTSRGGGGNTDNAGWHLSAVHAPQAWNITPGDENIIVAVVDDGCDVNHGMFEGKIIYPYNVFSKNSTLTFGSGHGTHTAGLAAGLIRSDGKAAGIAPGCKLMPVQVFSGENSTLSAEISGIAYAIHKGADVINISMGASYAKYKGIPEREQENIAKQKGKIEEKLWRRIFNMAKAKNVVLVFSAGNDNVVSFLNPQNRPDSIITVTAVDRQLNQAIFDSQGFGSDFGLGSTIASPGKEIYSTMPNNNFGMMQGTSQAAPIVTGTVALLKSIKKELTAAEAISILKKSGKQLSNNKLGPFVQADRALILLKTGHLPTEDADNNDNDNSEANYDGIINQIREHQRAIKDLIKKLPPEERNKLR